MSAFRSQSIGRPGADGAPRGVNVAGYLRTESGVGAAVRGYIRALRAAGIPTALADISDLQTNRSEDRTLMSFDDSYPHETNLVCADVELHYAIMAHLGEEFFANHYNVGIWAWELPQFPARWYDRFAYYDEIWCGTSFIVNSLAATAPVPVVRIPPVLTVESPGSRAAGRRRLGVSPEELVLLFIFDFHSHAERKNPLGVIDAFQEAFRPDDSVRLFIKCVNALPDSPEIAALRDRAAGLRIDFLCGYWPAKHVRDLMAASDVYVSLHRSEGTGLTITDAMSLGKPVIATGWSGNMDVMNVGNSFPVQFELLEIRKSVGPYTAGNVWAEPSIHHAAEMMRAVYENPTEGQRRGLQAQSDLERGFGEQAVAELVDRRLATIGVRRRFGDFRASAWADYGSYRDLGRRLRAHVQNALPRDASVLVVSKGDASLLDLGGLVSRHFPQDQDGAYAGYYPADSLDAIDQLEQVRTRGASHILFPSTALWWLDHYADFRSHLDSRYRRIVQNDDCLIYALASPAGERTRGGHFERNTAA